MKSETQSAPTAAPDSVLVVSADQYPAPRRRDKATHSGTCQVCGRVQKLPSGVLSKHGYTKRWGFFEGTCPGAHYQPFEQAFDRVQAAIDRTKQQISGLQDLKATLEAPIEAGANEAPFHKYDSRLGGYYETTVIVESVPSGNYSAIRFTEKHSSPDKPAKVYWGNTYGCYGTIEDAIRKLRDQRIGRIDQDIKRRNDYVQWQERRVREWKPGELQPVKEDA